MKKALMFGLIVAVSWMAFAADGKQQDKANDKRAKIDAVAQQTLERLFSESPQSKELFSKAHGYAVFPTVGRGGLVVGGFGSDLPSTAVYRLEPPYGRLDEPIPGVWDRLVPAGEELLALPENLLALPGSGMTTYRTDSGIAWVAGRARFTGPGGGGPGEGTIVISDALSRASAGLVFSGASSGQDSAPIVAAEAKNDAYETMRRAVPLHPTDYNYGHLAAKQAFHRSLFQWIPFFGSTLPNPGFSPNRRPVSTKKPWNGCHPDSCPPPAATRSATG